LQHQNETFGGVTPKIKTPRVSERVTLQHQASFDSLDQCDASLRTSSSLSRRSSTETILASPKIFGSEDFQDYSIDISSDSIRVEIGERSKEKSDAKSSENQKSFDKTSENQKSFDKTSETQKSFDKTSETQKSFDKTSQNQKSFDKSTSENQKLIDKTSENQRSFDKRFESSVSMDSFRQSSMSRDSSTDTVVLSHKEKKTFDKFPFEQIKPPQPESKKEEKLEKHEDKSTVEKLNQVSVLFQFNNKVIKGN
jgi:hypothetical protein